MSRTSVWVLRWMLFEVCDELFQLEVIVLFKSKQKRIGREVKESILGCAVGFIFLTDLFANRRSVNCASVGALILRNSSTNEPFHHCDISHFDWNEKVKIICLCARGLRMMSDALAHLCPAPIEWKVEQLKAYHWDSLMESVHKLLRLRSWIIRETTITFWKKITHLACLKMPVCSFLLSVWLPEVM